MDDEPTYNTLDGQLQVARFETYDAANKAYLLLTENHIDYGFLPHEFLLIPREAETYLHKAGLQFEYCSMDEVKKSSNAEKQADFRSYFFSKYGLRDPRKSD